MANANYKNCLDFTLKWEGGWSNHPKDPGGATMRGVTQAVYNRYRTSKGRPQQSVRHIEEAELQDIYRTGYWDTVSAHSLDVGPDLAIFDYSVNSGPGRARKAWLAAPKTAAPIDQVRAICRGRLAFLKRLGTWSTFGRGWGRRVAQCEAMGVKMALGAQGLSRTGSAKVLREEATNSAAKVEARKTSAKQSAGAGAAGAGGTVVSTASGFNWEVAVLFGLLLLLGGVVAYFMWKSAQEEQDFADAYSEMARAESVGDEPDFGRKEWVR